MDNQLEVGLIDYPQIKKEYYRGFISGGRTIADTIHLDEKLIKERKDRGLDINKFNTFLLGGCADITSLEAMIDFIHEIRPSQQSELLVLDLEELAFENLNRFEITSHDNINIRFIQGDLTSLPFQDNSVDYVRLDYVQNFISPKKQERLLRELKRILSDHGIISNVLSLKRKAKTKIEKAKRLISSQSGSSIVSRTVYGYKQLLLSDELLNRLCSRVKLNLQFGETPFTELSGDRNQHVIMTKNTRENPSKSCS